MRWSGALVSGDCHCDFDFDSQEELLGKSKSQLKPPYTGVLDRYIRGFDREFDLDSQEGARRRHH